MTATEPEGLTIERACRAVADWIAPARDLFEQGHVVHLSVSPGDGTAYAMTFVPPQQAALCTDREYPRVSPGQAVLALTVGSKAIPIAPDGSPDPSYVAEKLRTENAPEILTVGLCWWHMVGGKPDQAAVAYGRWLQSIGRNGAATLAEWDLRMFDGGALLPPGPQLPRLDLQMALSAYRASRGDHAERDASTADAAQDLAEAVEIFLGMKP